MFPKKHFEIVEKNGVEPYIFRRLTDASIELQILKVLKNIPLLLRVSATIIFDGGDERSRTVDPLLAKQVL